MSSEVGIYSSCESKTRRKMTGRGLGRGRGRRPVTGTEEEQAALVAASNSVILSDSDLSFCSDDSSEDGGGVADESKSTSTSSGGKGVKSEVAPRRAKGRGRGRPLMLPPSHSSTSLSSDLSLEDDLEKMSVTIQLDKSSDESVCLLKTIFTQPLHEIPGAFVDSSSRPATCV